MAENIAAMRLPRRALPGLVAATLAAPPAMAQPATLRAGGTGMALASLRRVTERFAAERPGIRVEVLPSLGTSGAIRALLARAIDVGLLARPPSAEEAAQGLRALPYARTPIAVVTSGGTDSTDITLQQLAAVLRGDVNTWPDGRRLRLVRREASDADWQLLASLSPEMGRSVAIAIRRPGLVTVGTDQENAEALQSVTGSLGLMSIGQLRAEGLRLRPLTLEGVEATTEAVAERRYALSRTLHAAWLGDATPPLADLLGFLGGAEARAILAGLGYGPPGP